MNGSLRTRLLASPAARVAALPFRARSVASANTRLLAASARWLVSSREHTNFTYDLTDLNLQYLAWFVANLAGIEASTSREYVTEILDDGALSLHVAEATRRGSQRWLADPRARLGRRIGWYALVRALKPEHVVETGTDKGLGSITLAAALMRNGRGRLTTIDINPTSGYLVSGSYASVVDRVVDDSIAILAELDEVDFFVHDSDHSADHERHELETVEHALSERAIVLSDNAKATDELARWAERTGRRFAFFDERPANHWYPGAGIGAAYRRP